MTLLTKLNDEDIEKLPYAAFDVLKPHAHIYDLGKYYNARVGDSRTPLIVRWFYGGVPKNLEGMHAFIIGEEGNGHWDKETDEIVMDPDSYKVEWEGDDSSVRSGGFSVFRLPDKVFAKSGFFHGYLGLKKADGTVESSIDVWFAILAGTFTMGASAKYFITDYQNALAQAKGDFAQAMGDLRTKYQNEVKANEDMSASTRQSLSSLADAAGSLRTDLLSLKHQIKDQNLVSRADAKELLDNQKQIIDGEINSKAYSLSQKVAKYYETVAEMQKDTSLVSGQEVVTRGYYGVQDGGGAEYKIVEAKPEMFNVKLQNGLYAEQIDRHGANYYYEITYNQNRDHVNNTDFYMVTVPKFDHVGNLIMPKISDIHTYSPNEWARHAHTTLTIGIDNAVPSGDTNNNFYGWLINDGKLLNTPESQYPYPNCARTIAIFNDRSIRDYQANEITGQALIESGAVAALTVYRKIVTGGKETIPSTSDATLSYRSDHMIPGGDPNKNQACLAFGCKPDGTWMFGACDGGTAADAGWTDHQLAQMMMSNGCDTVFRLDNGANVSVNVREMKINKDIDDGGKIDRKGQWTLDFVKPNAADNYNTVAVSYANESVQNAYAKLMTPIDSITDTYIAGNGATTIKSNDDLKKFLNSIPNRLNDSQLPNGAEVIGYLHFTYIPEFDSLLGTGNNNLTFKYSFTLDGTHTWGKILLSGVDNARYEVWRRYYRDNQGNPTWSDWQSTYGNQNVDVKKTDQVTNLWVIRDFNTVEVNTSAKIDGTDWKTIASGLPTPAVTNHSQMFPDDGGDAYCQVKVDDNGNLQAKAAKAGTYEVHYVYLAKYVGWGTADTKGL